MIAGLLSFSAYFFYILSILKGKTKPSRSTWWVLTLVGGLILWSSYDLGATESFWIQLNYVLGPLIIALFSVRYGEGRGLSYLDKVCLFGALVSGLLWIVFNSPLVGFIGSIVVDFIGLIPTIKKAYLDPKKEDPGAWLLETIASIVNALGVTVWFTLGSHDWIYALYLFLANATITMLLYRGKTWVVLRRPLP